MPIALLGAVPGLPDWATSLGISALVAKPFDPAGLPGAIRDALHW